MRNQTINERQREELSTCMPSCRNVAYPSLGICEEASEYIQKLLYLVDWNPHIPASDRSHLEFLLKGFCQVGLAIGSYAKKYRHDSTVPFTLKTENQVEFPELLRERLEGLQKECGDMKWMTDVIDFYIANPDGTDPTQPDCPMTAQLTADQNWQKLSARRAKNTIDGKGDDVRQPV